MMQSILNKWISFFLSYALVFTPSTLLAAEELALPSSDITPPSVEHMPSKKMAKAGQPYTITAVITDNNAVKSATLYYRQSGEENYKTAAMQTTMGSNQFSITLTAEDTQMPGVEYYIQATDLAGNSLLRGYSFSPLVLKLEPSEQLANTPPPTATPEEPETTSKNHWIWVGLGVLALGALAGGGGGGGDSSGNEPGTDVSPATGLSVTFTTSQPID